jgi:MFS family permease
MLGDQVYIVALAWQVQLLSSSATALSSVLLCYAFSQLIFLVLGGVIVDRLPRRSIMLASDIGRGLLVLIVAYLGQQHNLELWHLALLSAFNGAVAAFFMPARLAVQSQLVSKEQLGPANALMGQAFQVSVVAGPLLAAILIQNIAPKGAFVFDTLTFVVSAACILFIKNIPTTKVNTSTQPDSAKPRASLLADVMAGFVYVRTSTWLWVTIALFALIGLVTMGPMQALVAILVEQKFIGDVNIYGLLLSTRAVAALLGLVVLGQFKQLKRRGLLAYLNIILATLGVVCLGLGGNINSLLLCIVGIGAYGIGLGCFDVIWNTVMQEMVPPEYLGRVFSFDMLGSFCMIPLGLALAGWLADAWGVALVLLVSGFLSTVATLGCLLVGEIRTLA